MCAFVHGFEPYFYIESPPDFGPDDCDMMCNLLNVRLTQSFAFPALQSPSVSFGSEPRASQAGITGNHLQYDTRQDMKGCAVPAKLWRCKPGFPLPASA